MATDIRFKRGTTAAVDAYTPLVGEPVFDIEKKRLYIGTGASKEEIGGDALYQDIPLQIKDSIVYYYDSIRSKHLSVFRTLYGFGLNNRNISHPRIMSIAGGVLSSTSGYPISKMSTIVCIAAKITADATCSFSILKNGTGIGSLTLTNEKISNNNDFDANVDQDDCIQVLATPISGVINFPEVTLEISWRLT